MSGTLGWPNSNKSELQGLLKRNFKLYFTTQPFLTCGSYTGRFSEVISHWEKFYYTPEHPWFRFKLSFLIPLLLLIPTICTTPIFQLCGRLIGPFRGALNKPEHMSTLPLLRLWTVKLLRRYYTPTPRTIFCSLCPSLRFCEEESHLLSCVLLFSSSAAISHVIPIIDKALTVAAARKVLVPAVCPTCYSGFISVISTVALCVLWSCSYLLDGRHRWVVANKLENE